MKQGYEYIRIANNWDSLDELNRYSVNGWKMVWDSGKYFLLERPLTESEQKLSQEYYRVHP